MTLDLRLSVQHHARLAGVSFLAPQPRNEITLLLNVCLAFGDRISCFCEPFGQFGLVHFREASTQPNHWELGLRHHLAPNLTRSSHTRCERLMTPNGIIGMAYNSELVMAKSSKSELAKFLASDGAGDGTYVITARLASRPRAPTAKTSDGSIFRAAGYVSRDRPSPLLRSERSEARHGDIRSQARRR